MVWCDGDGVMVAGCLAWSKKQRSTFELACWFGWFAGAGPVVGAPKLTPGCWHQAPSSFRSRDRESPSHQVTKSPTHCATQPLSQPTTILVRPSHQPLAPPPDHTPARTTEAEKLRSKQQVNPRQQWMDGETTSPTRTISSRLRVARARSNSKNEAAKE
jgi:hypothetical protein